MSCAPVCVFRTDRRSVAVCSSRLVVMFSEIRQFDKLTVCVHMCHRGASLGSAVYNGERSARRPGTRGEGAHHAAALCVSLVVMCVCVCV